MASQELAQTLDFILNRCDERDIEAVAAAVVRRRRDIAMFGASSPSAIDMPSPRSLAEKITSQLDFGGSIESLKSSVRDYAIRIIKQQAPELGDKQIEKLMSSWIPEEQSSGRHNEQSIPRDLLTSMIDQFVSYSLGRMEEEEDRSLRGDIGPWPEKYWNAFPSVIRSLLTDFLKGEMDETDFKTRVEFALQLR